MAFCFRSKQTRKEMAPTCFDRFDAASIVVDHVYTGTNTGRVCVTFKVALDGGKHESKFDGWLAFGKLSTLLRDNLNGDEVRRALDAAWEQVESSVEDWVQHVNDINRLKLTVGTAYEPPCRRSGFWKRG